MASQCNFVSSSLAVFALVCLLLSRFTQPLEAKLAKPDHAVLDRAPVPDPDLGDATKSPLAGETSFGGSDQGEERIEETDGMSRVDWYKRPKDNRLGDSGDVEDHCEIYPDRCHHKDNRHRIVIIGSGPTGLGAAQRLYDLKQEDNNTVVTILEEQDKPGGLASSERDDQGFLWDIGVHVVFSHYTYFDRVLNLAVPEWNYRRRASFAFMMGSDGIRRFIPYPVQNNIHTMDKVDQQRSLSGLEEIARFPAGRKSKNFDEWLLQKFGAGLADVFMRKYNRKIWTVDTTEMNSAWVGERVAVPDIDEIKTKIAEVDSGANAKDSEWGPNRFFRYPKSNGTGGMWESVARRLPRRWFNFHSKVTGIDIDRKEIAVEVGKDIKSRHTMKYDKLISTVPLDSFVGFVKSSDALLSDLQGLASQLINTHTHIVGVGLLGQLPPTLADKSWVYFPDSDSPFYRLTMFSNYSDDHVPDPAAHWSLMCEIAEPEMSSDPAYWNRDNLVNESIRALVLYGFITADMVISKHYRRVEHGYPVPSLSRDMILDKVQPWLRSKDIYSRGRFGGWRYEVANQDHSFMQGVEAVDNLVHGVPELTYPDPNLANSKKNTDRIIPLDLEVVVAAERDESLEWLKPFAEHTLVYHLGTDLGPSLQFYAWQRLESVHVRAQVFLHHICVNYNQLADLTIFTQGDEETSRCLRCLRNPRQLPSAPIRVDPCEWRDCYGDSSEAGGDHQFPRCSQDNPASMAKIVPFLNQNCWGSAMPLTRHCWNECFGATKEMIQKHPLDRYYQAFKDLGRISDEDEDNGDFLQTLWIRIFT